MCLTNNLFHRAMASLFFESLWRRRSATALTTSCCSYRTDLLRKPDTAKCWHWRTMGSRMATLSSCLKLESLCLSTTQRYIYYHYRCACRNVSIMIILWDTKSGEESRASLGSYMASSLYSSIGLCCTWDLNNSPHVTNSEKILG